MSSDEAVEFDGIVDRVASAATEVAATEQHVGMRRRGSFGVLPAEIATSLVMVLNELLLNAVEHGFPPAAEPESPAGPASSAGPVSPVAPESPAEPGSSAAPETNGRSGVGGGSGVAGGAGGVLPPVAAGAASAAPPEVVVSAHRFRKQLHVTVADNGRGLPAGFDAESGSRLGLQIVRALVTGELRGTIELRNGAEGGTEALLVVPLARP
nr:ATP-binding protein [Micromonospora okii]